MSPSGSICSTSTPTVTDCAGKPRASLAAASAISPKPVPGMTGWPCTLWSSQPGNEIGPDIGLPDVVATGRQLDVRAQQRMGAGRLPGRR